MAVGKAKDESRYITTQANLDKKGKTNKKLKRSPLGQKYLTPKGRELKDAGEAWYKEHCKKKTS